MDVGNARVSLANTSDPLARNKPCGARVVKRRANVCGLEAIRKGTAPGRLRTLIFPSQHPAALRIGPPEISGPAPDRLRRHRRPLSSVPCVADRASDCLPARPHGSDLGAQRRTRIERSSPTPGTLSSPREQSRLNRSHPDSFQSAPRPQPSDLFHRRRQRQPHLQDARDQIPSRPRSHIGGGP
jgi:hypothetical protein